MQQSNRFNFATNHLIKDTYKLLRVHLLIHFHSNARKHDTKSRQEAFSKYFGMVEGHVFEFNKSYGKTRGVLTKMAQ